MYQHIGMPMNREVMEYYSAMDNMILGSFCVVADMLCSGKFSYVILILIVFQVKIPMHKTLLKPLWTHGLNYEHCEHF